MRALITGVTGFVGKYLADYLMKQGYEVWGTTRKSCPALVSHENIKFVRLDLLNQEEIIKLLNDIQPYEIYHLAGQSNVKDSWNDKVSTFQANCINTLNLLESVTKSNIAKTVKVLTVGSSEEYGKVEYTQMPIKENYPLNPISPYGMSKATVSLFAKHYHDVYGLNIVHARPFNHIGPGQRLGFVVSDFSHQIADIEKGTKENILYVGNLEAKRDFTDVRDIVRSYHLLLRKNGGYGQVYNVSSATAVSISEVLEILISLSNKDIVIKQDESKMRPADIPLYIGDNTKIKNEVGWKPEISIRETLNDILESLRK